MRLVLDKTAVRAAFDQAAEAYDLSAGPQRRIAARLAAMLPAHAPMRRILELGCGTGALTVHLRARYPLARIRAIDLSQRMIAACRRRWPDNDTLTFEVQDAEDLVSTDRFDLVAASSTFQWLPDRPGVMRRVRPLLAPSGILAIAAPVQGTLAELAHAHVQATGREMPQLDLWDEDGYASALQGEGFAIRDSRVEAFRACYNGPLEVMRSLRAIGAALRGYDGYQALTVHEMRDLAQAYERMHGDDDGNVPATYRVLYAVAEAGA